MKKILIILIVISISFMFFNCGEPEENIVHFITLEPGEEMVFQLDAVTKWDTITYNVLPDHAEFYEIFINEDDPPYYCFRYIAVPYYVPPSRGGAFEAANGSSDEYCILLKRDAPKFEQVQSHYFHVFFINNEELP